MSYNISYVTLFFYQKPPFLDADTYLRRELFSTAFFRGMNVPTYTSYAPLRRSWRGIFWIAFNKKAGGF